MSEWIRLMLLEIEQKEQEAEEAREEARRRDSGSGDTPPKRGPDRGGD